MSQNEALRQTNELRAAGKKLVMMSGGFDLLHIGHIEALEEAKRYGDALLVLVNSDSSIKKYKGKNRPIYNLNERIKILSSIEFVDYIVAFNDLNPVKYFELFRPDFFCNGSDWGNDFVGREILEKNSCNIVILKRKKTSTSYYIRKIFELCKHNENRCMVIQKDALKCLDRNLIKKMSNTYTVYSFDKKAISSVKKHKHSDIPIKRGLDNALLKLSRMNEIVLNKSYLISNDPDDIASAKKINLQAISYDTPEECAEAIKNKIS